MARREETNGPEGAPRIPHSRHRVRGENRSAAGSGAGSSVIRLWLLCGAALLLAACGAGRPRTTAHRSHAGPPRSSSTVALTHPTTSTTTTRQTPGGGQASAQQPLMKPANLAPFSGAAGGGEGVWRAAGRSVAGAPAVYETALRAPDATLRSGIAWMDTRLLSARLYSGSESPGGGPYRYTAPIEPARARSLVAAFNGGFMMNAAGGGYYAEGRTIDALRSGAASLVVYAGGSIDVGPWGSDVRMAPTVLAVRQNLLPLVAGGHPTRQAASSDWRAWGGTCGATSCAASVPGIEHQWRSGVGVTASGALVYATGPALDPLQLAQLLVRAGVIRGMQLDINPDWTVFVTYDPPTPGGLAAASNGQQLLHGTVQGPWTFFEDWWARDFVTMSARPARR